MRPEIAKQLNFHLPFEHCCENCKYLGREYIFQQNLEFCDHPKVRQYSPQDKEVSVVCVCDLYEGKDLEGEGN